MEGASNLLKLVKNIQNDCLNSQCPKCKTPFFDFTGCCAVTCETCKTGFCGLCLEDTNGDAHPHVQSCPILPTFGYFRPQVEIFEAQARVKKRRVLNAIKAAGLTQDQALDVLGRLEQDLKDLHIVIDVTMLT